MWVCIHISPSGGSRATRPVTIDSSMFSSVWSDVPKCDYLHDLSTKTGCARWQVWFPKHEDVLQIKLSIKITIW